jgi:ubiquitin-conjugating enzyme E2 Q
LRGTNDFQRCQFRFVRIRLEFFDNFPFYPPFARVISPSLKGGFVMPGGALCMEVLTPHGWTPATSIESLLVTVGY